MSASSPLQGEVRSALGCIYERCLAAITDPQAEGTLSGSYALAVRRRSRRGREAERDGLSEAPSDLGSPVKVLASPRPLASERNDPSDGEPGQASQQTRVKKNRRASVTSMFDRLEAPTSIPTSPR